MCSPYDDLSYPVDAAFRLLGRRWGPEVLIQMVRGTSRYSQLQRALPGVSPRTLSVRISEFRRAGIIAKKHSHHIGTAYELTSKGKEFAKMLDSIASFTIRWHPTQAG